MPKRLNKKKVSKKREMAGTRREVLRLYKSILRLGQRWEAADPIETRVEREYIVDEARYTFFEGHSFFQE